MSKTDLGPQGNKSLDTNEAVARLRKNVLEGLGPDLDDVEAVLDERDALFGLLKKERSEVENLSARVADRERELAETVDERDDLRLESTTRLAAYEGEVALRIRLREERDTLRADCLRYDTALARMTEERDALRERLEAAEKINEQD